MDKTVANTTPVLQVRAVVFDQNVHSLHFWLNFLIDDVMGRTLEGLQNPGVQIFQSENPGDFSNSQWRDQQAVFCSEGHEPRGGQKLTKQKGMNDVTKILGDIGAGLLPGWNSYDYRCACLGTLMDVESNRCQWLTCCQFTSRLSEPGIHIDQEDLVCQTEEDLFISAQASLEHNQP
ncbi:hypothetical protein T265_13364, partial [Opisthorchis viverrini]